MECLICNRIQAIQNKENPYFIKDLETGYVVLGDFQYFKGYTIFLSKIHAAELHDLDHKFMMKFLEEMAKVAKAVYLSFKPDKLNYEMLGNGDPHLHWHIFPRYKSDSDFRSPVWVIDKSIRYAESQRPSPDQIDEWRQRLLKYL